MLFYLLFHQKYDTLPYKESYKYERIKMLKYIRTHEAYTGRTEDVYNEKGERLFTLRTTYSSEYAAGGDQMEETIESIIAHFNLKGETPLEAYMRIREEDYRKNTRQHHLERTKQMRVARESDPVWQVRTQAARLLVRQNLKEAAHLLICDYLEHHRS